MSYSSTIIFSVVLTSLYSPQVPIILPLIKLSPSSFSQEIKLEIKTNN